MIPTPTNYCQLFQSHPKHPNYPNQPKHPSHPYHPIHPNHLNQSIHPNPPSTLTTPTTQTTLSTPITLTTRGRQFKKVFTCKTVLDSPMVKYPNSHLHFPSSLNLEPHSGLKVRGSEINFIK